MLIYYTNSYPSYFTYHIIWSAGTRKHMEKAHIHRHKFHITKTRKKITADVVSMTRWIPFRKLNGTDEIVISVKCLRILQVAWHCLATMTMRSCTVFAVVRMLGTHKHPLTHTHCAYSVCCGNFGITWVLLLFFCWFGQKRREDN